MGGEGQPWAVGKGPPTPPNDLQGRKTTIVGRVKADIESGQTMQKSTVFLRGWGVALLGILLVALLGGCTIGMERASIAMMDEAEANWQAQPALDYEITVEVDRPDDRRRTTVVVAGGAIVQGTVTYWDPNNRRWQEPYELNEEQAFPFTVPGLFEMVRGEIRGSGRADIRVKMGGDPPFPRRIVLGPVFMDGRPVSGTEATVVVTSYEPR